MGLIIKEVLTKRDLRDFICLPAKIHQGHKNWIPPIYMDEWSFFNPKKNLSFASCDHIRLLAYRDGKPVGRIMGLVSHKYNQIKKENNARFCYFETYDDHEVAHALLSRIEDWARALGKDKLIGPLGFSDKEPQGFLVEGFDEAVVLAANCNYEYQVELVRKEGFQTEIKLVSYLAEVPQTLPPIYQRIVPRLEQLNSEFRIVEFTSKWTLRKYIRPVLSLTNRAFRQIYGSLPYEEREMDDFANRFIIFLDPNFIKVVLNQQGELIAYIVAMPDIAEGLKKSKGKLLPFGLFTVLRSGKKTDRVVSLLGAIDEPYRGRGLDVLLALKIFESARKKGKKYIDSHLVLEDNYAMRGEYERIGGKVYKRYQIFSKSL
jgi:GNAT superfamily N-acetyltransferase